MRKILLALAGVIFGSYCFSHHPVRAVEQSCPELRMVFVRGSGGKRWEDANYLAFREAMEKKLAGTGLDYEFLDLDYPAVGVGLDNLWTTLGAFFGAGDAYEFGESVNAGVRELKNVVNEGCKETKYVIGGYSQGAMVISKALRLLNAEKVIYAATFGDPKIYLPEGAGKDPIACQSLGLSEYRIYVPDCHAYEGLLGSYRPYQPEEFSGKLGTWCNGSDIFCSSFISIRAHTSYTTDKLYEAASETIAEKILETFGLAEPVAKPEMDVVILAAEDYRIEGEGKLARLAEMRTLAEKVLEQNGRVGLYGFSTASFTGKSELRLYCRMGQCSTPGQVGAVVNSPLGGTAIGILRTQSLAEAVTDVLRGIEWAEGREKVVVLLARHRLVGNYDSQAVRDLVTVGNELGIRLYAGVDFTGYTEGWQAESIADFEKITEVLGGATFVVGAEGWQEALFDKVMAGLRIPEGEVGYGVNLMNEAGEERLVIETEEEFPELSEVMVKMTDEGTVKISFRNTGERVIVILNERVLGMSAETEITVSGLDRTVGNVISLVPLSSTRRGQRKEIALPAVIGEGINDGAGADGMGGASGVFVPKAPNTGVASGMKKRLAD